MKKSIKLFVIFGVVALLFTSCKLSTKSDRKETSRVEQQQNVYVDSQPIPAFDWSLERHIFIELYEARNNAVKTYSYIRNWQGEIIWSCDSIGFPLAANMQLTNPAKIADSYVQGGFAILPQAEPNGLFSSPSNVGTYVFCVNSDGTISPSYFEMTVETHLSPLTVDGSKLSGDGGLKIEVKE